MKVLSSIRVFFPKTIVFFFFVFQEKIKFRIFLSQCPFSLFVGKACLSDRIFSENFFVCGGWLLYKLHWGTAFWVKKEFPNVTHKVMSPLQRKNFWIKYGRWDKFSRRREKVVTETEKFVGYLQKNRKIIVSVTVISAAPLQKNTSQWQTFGEMKLKIKKRRKKNNIRKPCFSGRWAKFLHNFILNILHTRKIMFYHFQELKVIQYLRDLQKWQ